MVYGTISYKTIDILGGEIMKKAIGLSLMCLLLEIYTGTVFAASNTLTKAISTNTTGTTGKIAIVQEKVVANRFSATEARLPTINKVYAEGVAGAFSGIVGNKLILAGGYNYPQNTIHNMAEKQYFKDIFLSEVSSSPKKLSWKKMGELTEELANGAAVTTDTALYLIGGSNKNGAKATCIEIKPVANSLKCETISWLPVTVSDSGAACIDDYLYVVGGIQNGKPSNDVYRMNLKGDRKKWEKLPPVPEDSRIQPIVATQKDASGKTLLYVWAGFSGWGNSADLICGGYKYNPNTNQWLGLGAPLKNEKRVYLGGGNALPLGEDKIIAFGGFNYEVLRNSLVKPDAEYNAHAPEWYKHNQEVYCFDTKTNKWSNIGELPALGTVHAGSAKFGNNIYNISGEIKPGTNTNIVTILGF